MECWHNSFVIFQGIRTRIAKEPYIFVIFQGGGGGGGGGGGDSEINHTGAKNWNKKSYY